MAGMSDGMRAVQAELVRLFAAHADEYGFQARVARRVGVTSSAASSWAQGRTVPDADKWAKLEEAFKLPAGYFASIAGGQRAEPVSRDEGVDLADVAQLVQAVAGRVDDLHARLDELAAARDALLVRLHRLEQQAPQHSAPGRPASQPRRPGKRQRD